MNKELAKSESRGGTGTREGTRGRIIRAAEQLFAELGYDGASVRRIALAADVPIALINYHYGSKEGLYRAVFEARTPTIVDQRLAGLELAAMETDLDRRLELAVKALIVPMFRLRATEGNSSFVRIMSREVTDPNANSRGIITEFFDPVAENVIDELRACLPGRSEEDIHWGYNAMLGVMVYIVGDTGRISRLSGGKCDPGNYEEASAYVVSLLVAALKHGGLGPVRNPGGDKE